MAEDSGSCFRLAGARVIFQGAFADDPSPLISSAAVKARSPLTVDFFLFIDPPDLFLCLPTVCDSRAANMPSRNFGKLSK
jgi:hypothetical protein